MARNKKEEECERKADHEKKKFVHAMYDESVRLANEKKDRIKLEENLFDLNRLETLISTSNEEEVKRLQRKVSIQDNVTRVYASKVVLGD